MYEASNGKTNARKYRHGPNEVELYDTCAILVQEKIKCLCRIILNIYMKRKAEAGEARGHLWLVNNLIPSPTVRASWTRRERSQDRDLLTLSELSLSLAEYYTVTTGMLLVHRRYTAVASVREKSIVHAK